MIKYINQQVQEGLNEATTQQILGKTKQKGKEREWVSGIQKVL